MKKNLFPDQIDFCTKLLKNDKLDKMDLYTFLATIHKYKIPKKSSVFFKNQRKSVKKKI